jgi:hypothetical protein
VFFLFTFHIAFAVSLFCLCRSPPKEEEKTMKLAALFVALFLGLGWAIRGHFGHEWGAAWAGGIAALATVVAAKRTDWLRRLPVLAALGAIGWAVGGMMSYGLIVGYGRGTDFGNVLYGLLMLAVIGGLYGFIGGGLFGLGLDTTPENKPDWPALLTQMVAAGYLFWGTLIYQFEWFMTPPRSELWAACLGAAAALAWYLQRCGYMRALRVAGYSALGAGFGFAFGNFVQVMGNVSGLAFNWWNAMEFTLGFFGGLGMAYGVYSRNWPASIQPSKVANGIALTFLLVALPVINLINAFDSEKLVEMAENLGVGDPGAFAIWLLTLGWLAIAIFTSAGLLSWRSLKTGLFFLLGYAVYYTIFSHIRKGFFFSPGGLQLEQYLYWLVLAVAGFVWYLNRGHESSFPDQEREDSWRRWLRLLALAGAVIVVITWIAINSHAELPGAHNRF